MQSATPITIDDPVNAKILSTSEDMIEGFHRRPFDVIAQQCGVPSDEVRHRIAVMLEAGTIRRVRQTLLAINLAHGALVAWKVDADRLNAGFDWMHNNDPFTGHSVIRSTDGDTPGSDFRLWTTLKVPQGYDFDKHCRYLQSVIGAEQYLALPAKRLFKLGVGHVRRRSLEPGARSDTAVIATKPELIELNEEQWRVLVAMKRELDAEEIIDEPWAGRANEADVSLDRFYEVADQLVALKLMGRFSTFLEHVKPVSGKAVTRYNGLFHWAVPAGKELEAGMEVGRHHCMTHAYWREAGPAFGNVNIMGVVHGTEKDRVLAHKQAIDDHLAEAGIEVYYTNVFWGGRSEIKPSEVSPIAYRQWCEQQHIDPQQMRA